MTATYVAWNGQSYPWPPPEGWYLASDGQWWASGTGPNPPATALSDLPPEARQNPQASPGSASPAQQPNLAQSGQQAPNNTPQPGAPGAQAPAQGPGPQPTPQQWAPNAGGPTPTNVVGPPPTNAPGAIWQQPSDRPKSTMSTGLIAGLAVMALIIFAGLVALVSGLGGDNDQTEASSPDDAEISTTTEASQTTLELETTTTTEASTTTTEAETTTTVTLPPEELVAAFRARLDEDELTADQLSDEDVIEFGATFCILAQIADDSTAFDTFRAQAIAESDGDLTEDELNMVIDDVIIVFCPEEAARLGIS